MHWNTKHAKRCLMMWAEPQPGYRFEVTARDTDDMARAHAATPDQKRHQIASVPTMEIAILAAERVWEVEFRKQQTAEQMKAVNQARAEGPAVRYVLDVTEPQAMVAQYCLETLYGTVVSMRMLQDDTEDAPSTALLHPPSLWRAVRAVNVDLAARGEWPPMRDILMEASPGGAANHELTMFLQNNFCWEDEELVEAIWPRRGVVWADLASDHPALFDTRARPVST